MTQSEQNETPDDPKALRAAEYALGVLNSEEEAQIRELAARDSTLRRELIRWEEQLSRFAEELAPVDPPEKVWRSLELYLARGLGEQRGFHVKADAKPSLWNNAAFWRGISFASLATAAAACVVAIAASFQSSTIAPVNGRLVAALAAGEGRAAFVATYDPARKQIVIIPATVLDDPNRVPELWLVTRDNRVISLGVIPSGKAEAVQIPPELVDETSAGAGLVITLEPPGGAPGGVATGPAIAKGELSPI